MAVADRRRASDGLTPARLVRRTLLYRRHLEEERPTGGGAPRGDRGGGGARPKPPVHHRQPRCVLRRRRRADAGPPRSVRSGVRAAWARRRVPAPASRLLRSARRRFVRHDARAPLAVLAQRPDRRPHFHVRTALPCVALAPELLRLDPAPRDGRRRRAHRRHRPGTPGAGGCHRRADAGALNVAIPADVAFALSRTMRACPSTAYCSSSLRAPAHITLL